MSESGANEDTGDVEDGAQGKAEKKAEKKAARWHRTTKYAVSTSMVAFVGLTLALEIAVQLASVPPLDVTAVESVRFFAEDGTLLREAVDINGMRARFVPKEKLSSDIVTATIAVEDVRFREHGGVDPRSTARAIYENLRAQKVVRGASTLTMQLVRLLRPHSTTLAEKAQEAVTALAMERVYTKDQILEAYLNQATYGAGTRGVEAAAIRYFGRPHRDLSLAQVALLAGLPKAPTALNPFRHPDAALKRRNLVLRRLRSVVEVKTGVGISVEEIERAQREPLSLAAAHTMEPLAMHFSEWVTTQWAERAATVGATSDGTSTTQLQGDVVTTIESDWQRQSQNLVGQHIAALQAGGGRDAAVVIVDNATCAVRVMVGSAGYFNARGGAVNAATSLRQPGSTLKPFTYALAFEAGHSPRTVVADIESFYGAPDGVVFRPRNYSKVFHGPVLMGEALGRSLNVPAIRTMGLLEIGALLRRMRKLGVMSLTKSAEHYGLGLTLGNGEVTLVELVGAYAALARGGVPCTPTGLQNVANATNTPIGSTQRKRVIDGDVVAMVTHILSDEVLRQRAFGPRNALMLGFPMAIKTGTSSNWRDTWAIGYTPEITIGVWTGDVEGAPTHGLAGATGAGPLFHQIAKAFAAKARKAFPKPRRQPRPGAHPNAKAASSLVDVEVCALSGLLPQQQCDHLATVRVRQSDVPLKSCHWHRSVEVDTRNGLRAGKGCPKKFVTAHQVVALPAAYAEWQQTSVLAVMPSSTSPLCPDSGAVPDAVVVRYPRAGEVFIIEPGYDRARQSIQLRGEIDPATAKAEWIVDGSVVENVKWPYVGDWALKPGDHVVQLRANKRLSDPVAFEVK